MLQKIISFDIGIKNLALCLFSYDTETKQIQILEWDILNLIPQQTEPGDKAPQKITCSQCCKKSLYVSPNEEQTFCEKHAKLSPFFLPVLKLQSKTKEDLQQMVLDKGHKIDKKGALIEHIKNNLLKKRKPSQKTSEICLIDIGRRLNTLLSERRFTEDINHVLIENQIGPLAIRMRTIQGMITSFFIIKSPEAHIEYISSHNKGNLRSKDQGNGQPSVPLTPSLLMQPLQEVYVSSSKNKKTVLDENIPDNEIIPVEKKTSNYAENKKQSVELVKRICPPSHLEFFLSHKKKDDLADCFLQGVWFVKVKNK